MPRLSIVMTPLNSTHPNFKWNVFILNFSIHHTIIKSVMIVFGRNDHRIDRIIVLVISQRPCETAHLCLKIGDVIGVNVFPSMLMRFPTPPQKGLKHPYYTYEIWFNIAQCLLSETAFNHLTALFCVVTQHFRSQGRGWSRNAFPGDSKTNDCVRQKEITNSQFISLFCLFAFSLQ